MTDQYAVFGNPIAHSKSPKIHSEFAKLTGVTLNYTAILAPIDDFAGALADFIQHGGKGANVTIPFKQEACRLATVLSERAQLAQAVNTLTFNNGVIYGDNTDGAGLVRDIQDNLKFSIQHKRILLLGAGGAARGVILPLLKQQPDSLTIANRTAEKAHELQHQFSAYGQVEGGSYDHLAGRTFDLVINATSSSLNNALPPVPAGIFASNALAYDMMYGTGLTPFLAFAGAQGAAQLADGLGMLVEQAAESFFVWRGIRPATQPVITLLKN